MTPRGKRILITLAVAIGLVVMMSTVFRLPWNSMASALLGGNSKILLIALAVNLISLLVKGWGWHLLLKPVAPNRWIVAQEANLIGATINNLSISVAGEAARIHLIVKRDHVPLRPAVVSVMWARTVEAAGFGLFLLVVPSLLHLPPFVRRTQIGAMAMLMTLFALSWFYQGWHFPRWLPQSVSAALISLAEIGSPRRLAWPALFSLINWAAQWTTFHLVLVAMHTHPSLGASFMALLATNLGGLLRLTPASIGIFQVSMVAALLPFGIASGEAMAASLALQGIQVIPVLAVGLALGGWKVMKSSSVYLRTAFSDS